MKKLVSHIDSANNNSKANNYCTSTWKWLFESKKQSTADLKHYYWNWETSTSGYSETEIKKEENRFSNSSSHQYSTENDYYLLTPVSNVECWQSKHTTSTRKGTLSPKCTQDSEIRFRFPRIAKWFRNRYRSPSPSKRKMNVVITIPCPIKSKRRLDVLIWLNNRKKLRESLNENTYLLNLRKGIVILNIKPTVENIMIQFYNIRRANELKICDILKAQTLPKRVQKKIVNKKQSKFKKSCKWQHSKFLKALINAKQFGYYQARWLLLNQTKESKHLISSTDKLNVPICFNDNLQCFKLSPNKNLLKKNMKDDIKCVVETPNVNQSCAISTTQRALSFPLSIIKQPKCPPAPLLQLDVDKYNEKLVKLNNEKGNNVANKCKFHDKSIDSLPDSESISPLIQENQLKKSSVQMKISRNDQMLHPIRLKTLKKSWESSLKNDATSSGNIVIRIDPVCVNTESIIQNNVNQNKKKINECSINNKNKINHFNKHNAIVNIANLKTNPLYYSKSYRDSNNLVNNHARKSENNNAIFRDENMSSKSLLEIQDFIPSFQILHKNCKHYPHSSITNYEKLIDMYKKKYKNDNYQETIPYYNKSDNFENTNKLIEIIDPSCPIHSPKSEYTKNNETTNFVIINSSCAVHSPLKKYVENFVQDNKIDVEKSELGLDNAEKCYPSFINQNENAEFKESECMRKYDVDTNDDYVIPSEIISLSKDIRQQLQKQNSDSSTDTSSTGSFILEESEFSGDDARNDQCKVNKWQLSSGNDFRNVNSAKGELTNEFINAIGNMNEYSNRYESIENEWNLPTHSVVETASSSSISSVFVCDSSSSVTVHRL